MKHVDPETLWDSEPWGKSKRSAEGRRKFYRLRLGEERKILCDQYGRGGSVPGERQAHGFLCALMDSTIGANGSQDAVRRVTKWCRAYAPWARQEQIEEAFERVEFRFEHRLSMWGAGKFMELTDADRTRLKIRTIRPFDMLDRDFNRRAIERERAKDRERKAKKRQEAGATPRSQSLSQLEPWKAEGISRKTWERRRRDANSSPHKESYTGCPDETASPPASVISEPDSKTNKKEKDDQCSAPRFEGFEAFCAAVAAARLRQRARKEAAAAESERAYA